jgi:hypothetical protein
MSDQLRDPIIDRVRETLRSAPAAVPDARAVARTLQAVWAAPRPAWWRRALDAWRMPALSGLATSAVAVAALLVGFVTRGAVQTRDASEPLAASGPATGEYPVHLASAASDETALVPTQFVFEHATATSVSVVGEFNAWEADALPLTKVANGLWTATVPLPPGRHVYAYVIDGTLVVADPRAPKAGDADYGREGSVVMVFAR